MPPLVVMALGDPVMDLLACVSHEFLSTITDEPGGCYTVSPEDMKALLTIVSEASTIKRMPGGSAANVAKGLANLMQGCMTAKFLGMVGQDATGREYRSCLEKQGVIPVLMESTSTSPSAVALCLVTPDGQRTMRTCLGASLDLRSASQVSPGWSKGLAMLHCEGYCLYRPNLAKEMMLAAKADGALVSMDLASFELVRNCLSGLVDLLESGCLDIVFANESEAAELAMQLKLTPESASHEELVAATQSYLLKKTRLSVVSLGPKGCIARCSKGQEVSAPAEDVEVVDTIGAGDIFSSGFLAAYLQGAPLQTCAESGCAAGAQAVQGSGAELDAISWAKLRVQISSLVAAATEPTDRLGAGPVA